MEKEKRERLQNGGWKVGTTDEVLGVSPEALELRAMISRVTHDARTPLSSIIGFSELLLEDESLTGQTREYLQIINDEGQRLAAILDRLSSGSRE